VRAPLSWLRDFAPFEGDPKELAAALDDIGLVVEGVEVIGERLDDIVVARVTEISAIEGKDRIRRVLVDAGADPVEIVCGATNFAVDDLVPLAPVGAVLPGGFAISMRKMGGVTSNGMLCSGRELGIDDDADGLLLLTDIEGAGPGQPLTEAMGIERDVVFDITVEGNRPDAWSMAGVARDLAARLGLSFTLPTPAPGPEGSTALADIATARVDAPELCPRLVVRVLEDVTIGPSPRWMARRLALAGMRSINNVVDASNYVMLELGQPTHPYDADKLPTPGLIVRQARPGEALVTLDGVERILGTPGRGLGDTGVDCVICDTNDTVIGIAGVMGGESSEIGEGTSTVLLEAAYFTPMAIARTSKRLGLRSEASARFERGADPWGIDRAVERFCELVALTSHGARTARGTLDVRSHVPEPIQVLVPLARVNVLLGTSLSGDQVASLLEPMGFGAEPTHGTVLVTVPTNRPDIRPAPHGIADITEEIGRAYGYARLDRRQPAWPAVGGLTERQRQRRLLRQVLAGLGASEAWTPTFVSDEDHRLIGLEGPAIRVANSLSAEEAWLRRSQLPGLLHALAYNQDRRQASVRLFEIGTVFSHPDVTGGHQARSGSGGAELTVVPDERELASVVFALENDDARHAVAAWGVVETALRMRGVALVAPGSSDLEGTAGPAPGLHPTRSAWLVAEPSAIVVGSVGEIDPAVLSAVGLEDGGSPGLRRVGWLELDFGRFVDPAVVARANESSRPLSRFPSSDIDLAFVLDDPVPAAALLATMRNAGGELLASAELFDVFRGQGVPEGSRSLAVRLRFCAMDHTLTDAEVGQLRRACIDAARPIGAVLR